jgi:hypothetical protein
MEISWREFEALKLTFIESIKKKKAFFSHDYKDIFDDSVYTSFLIFPDPINKMIQAYYDYLNDTPEMKVNEIIQNINSVREDYFLSAISELKNLYTRLYTIYSVTNKDTLDVNMYKVLFMNDSQKLNELKLLVETPEIDPHNGS